MFEQSEGQNSPVTNPIDSENGTTAREGGPRTREEEQQRLEAALAERKRKAIEQMKEFQERIPGVAEILGKTGEGSFLLITKPTKTTEMVTNGNGENTVEASVGIHPLLTEAGWRVLKIYEYGVNGPNSYEQSEAALQKKLDSLITAISDHREFLDNSKYLIDGGKETLIIDIQDSSVKIAGTEIVAQLGDSSNVYTRVEKATDTAALQQMIEAAKQEAGIYPKIAANLESVEEDLQQMNAVTF